jgi:hypothetical protein
VPHRSDRWSVLARPAKLTVTPHSRIRSSTAARHSIESLALSGRSRTRSQIVFSDWVTSREQKWVNSREHRGPRAEGRGPSGQDPPRQGGPSRRSVLFERQATSRRTAATPRNYPRSSRSFGSSVTRASSKNDVEAIPAFAERVLPRGRRPWVEASLDQRQRLQQLFCPDGIAFDGNRFCCVPAWAGVVTIRAACLEAWMKRRRKKAIRHSSA